MTGVLGVIKMNVFHLPGNGPRVAAGPVRTAHFKGSNSLWKDGTWANLATAQVDPSLHPKLFALLQLQFSPHLVQWALLGAM